MVTDKQRENLAKGRAKGIKRGKQNRAVNGQSWADLISAYGETRAPVELAAATGKKDATWKDVVVASAYRQAAGGNASILRELMQRSEPQDIGIKLNFPALTDEQVNRIADGEDPRTVLASPGAGGT